MGHNSIAITPDLKANRAWNTAATAAATNSATTATKAAAAGKQWVITGFRAGMVSTATAASTTTDKVVTVKKGTTATRYYTLPKEGTIAVQWDEDDWVIGGVNAAVSIEIAATGVSDATGYLHMNGFHIGIR